MATQFRFEHRVFAKLLACFRAVAKLCLILFATTVISSCGGTVSNSGFSVQGMWGGEHIRIIVGETHSTIEYDCALGTIDEPIQPDSQGYFRVFGSHVIGHGGPAREGEWADRHPARYQGRIDENRMSLTVILTDTGQTVGTFNLLLENPGRLFECY